MTEWAPLIAHAGLLIGLFAWLRSDINILRRETNARFDRTDARFTELHNDIQALDVRMARVEATLDTAIRLQGGLPAERRDKVA